MTRKRRYQLLCPVARSLDVLGDRWSLLILRDLHAGPARFHQLQEGLGMATNLLASRLSELAEAGLIHRLGEDRHDAYALTELGRGTDRLLWELVRFGSQIDRDPDPRPPGNLRTIALPLRMMLSAVDDRPTLTAHLVVDGETIAIDVSPTDVHVSYGETDVVVDVTPDVVVATDYESFLDLAEGRIGLDDFSADRLEIVDGAERVGEFGGLMAKAIALAPTLPG